MKAITIHQPWASLIAIGAKQYETRSWSTKYRGPIAIHASKKDALKLLSTCPRKFVQAVFDAFKQHEALRMSLLNSGCIVAIAEIVDVHKVEDLTPSEQERMFGEWEPGRYAWELKNVKVLPSPIPVKGKQGLWNWNEEETECH